MFVIVVRDEAGRLAAWGNPMGYFTKMTAEDAAGDCYEEFEIGEGKDLSAAKRNAKFKFAQKYKGQSAEIAHRNVRSTE